MSRRINRFPIIGENVFPSPSASRRGRRIEWTPFRRCVQCGLPNDTRRTSWAKKGDGIGPPQDVFFTFVTKIGDITEEVTRLQGGAKDKDILGGCRFCGSKFWQRSKPFKLPDTRNFPASNWRGLRR